MFQFPRFAFLAYGFSQESLGFAKRGCPIRKSTDKLASSNPWLFAGNHVLHRLSVPRHPPHALTSLAENHSAAAVIRKSRPLLNPVQRTIIDSLALRHMQLMLLPLHSTVKDRNPRVRERGRR